MLKRTALEVATEIVDALDKRIPVSELISEFASLVPYPQPGSLFVTDKSPEEIVQRALGFERIARDAPDRLSRLAELVRKVRGLEGDECDWEIAEDVLRASVAHPDICSLLNNAALSDEEVIEIADSYNAVRLPRASSGNPGEP